MEHIAALPEALPGLSISLLSKVLHRKRPHLIPLLDRHIIDWYRPLTGKRAAAEAWPPLVRSLRSEELDLERRHLMSTALNRIEDALWPAMDRDDRPGLSWIRAVDIAIWMGSR